MEASSWSSVLMRRRCLSGTSMGMVAIIAGLWKAWPTARATQTRVSNTSETSPARMMNPAINEMSPMAPSATIMIILRLCLSATMPPKGERRPMGSITHMFITASTSALPVDSVTYHTTAYPAA